MAANRFRERHPWTFADGSKRAKLDVERLGVELALGGDTAHYLNAELWRIRVGYPPPERFHWYKGRGAFGFFWHVSGAGAREWYFNLDFCEALHSARARPTIYKRLVSENGREVNGGSDPRGKWTVVWDWRDALNTEDDMLAAFGWLRLEMKRC